VNLTPEQRTIATQRARIDELEEALRQAREDLATHGDRQPDSVSRLNAHARNARS
jgi:hypothetical protein